MGERERSQWAGGRVDLSEKWTYCPLHSQLGKQLAEPQQTRVGAPGAWEECPMSFCTHLHTTISALHSTTPALHSTMPPLHTTARLHTTTTAQPHHHTSTLHCHASLPHHQSCPSHHHASQIHHHTPTTPLAAQPQSHARLHSPICSHVYASSLPLQPPISPPHPTLLNLALVPPGRILSIPQLPSTAPLPSAPLPSNP